MKTDGGFFSMEERYASALNALEKLKEGNKAYLNSEKNAGDISPKSRLFLSQHGQHPYAVIVGCADSRVMPESIFSAGLGELFVIRAAGNVLDNFALGSVEYAAEHLGCKLIVVMGHTGCGAVGAAHGQHGGYLKHITDEIAQAIGQETDPVKASILNVKHGVQKIKTQLPDLEGVLVIGALYHTDSGLVEFCDLPEKL